MHHLRSIGNTRGTETSSKTQVSQTDTRILLFRNRDTRNRETVKRTVTDVPNHTKYNLLRIVTLQVITLCRTEGGQWCPYVK